jgi:hypothetical protein
MYQKQKSSPNQRIPLKETKFTAQIQTFVKCKTTFLILNAQGGTTI